MKHLAFILVVLLTPGACSTPDGPVSHIPTEIIDLGALVTEDLPEKVWGKALMEQLGYTENNTFRVIHWEVDLPAGSVLGSNSYFNLFNHGGPHVDMPSHVGYDRRLDSYPIDAFTGPLKVIDVSHFPVGRSVTVDEIKKYDIRPGDIVLIYTGYQFPGENEFPERIALNQEAARYLANLPVHAFGTDAYNVDSDDNESTVESDIPLEPIAPIHFAFLSKGIPLFEQLFNLDKLLDKKDMYFVGPPLNIKDGDGMIVRPAVLVYD